MAIGIFDSGLGGLSVYKEIIKKYDNEKIIYFADTSNFPYGEKSKEQIIEFSKKIVEFLISQKVDKIIIACNTASAFAMEELKKIYNIEIMGIIYPVCEYIIYNNIDNITVIATKATVNSKVYDSILKDKIVKNISAPKLVSLAENISKDENILKEYFDTIKPNSNVVLACTHFPLLKDYIKTIYKNINLIDPAKYLVDKLELRNNDNEKDIFYISTDNVVEYREKINKLLERDDVDVRVHKW